MVLNVTVTQPKTVGWVPVLIPTAPAPPAASNLNFVAGRETIPNLVVAKVGADGKVDFHNGSAGTIQVVTDVSGWFGAD